MTERFCPCGASITRQSKTGHCRPCAIRNMHADPDYQRRRLEGLGRHFDRPGVREAAGRHLAKGHADWIANMSPDERQRLSEHGKALVRDYLSRPDIRARALSPEARATASAKYVESRLGWCPEEHRAAYDELIYVKKFSSAEARRMIEQLIPGTVENGKLEVANHQLASRLRHERAVREAY